MNGRSLPSAAATWVGGRSTLAARGGPIASPSTSGGGPAPQGTVCCHQRGLGQGDLGLIRRTLEVGRGGLHAAQEAPLQLVEFVRVVLKVSHGEGLTSL